jgi:hypothetical protein
MRLLVKRVVVGALAGLAACGGAGDPIASAPARLIVVGDQQAGTAGNRLTEAVGVQIVDAAGRGVRGVNTTFDVQGGGSVSSTTGASNDSGFVRTTWTLGTKVGDQQRLVVHAGDGGALTATVSATPRADVPSTVRVVSGPTNAANGVALSPIIVAVADRYGNDVATSGVQITASAPQRTLRGTPTATTDASGRATFSGLTVVGKAGAASITFAASPLTGSMPLTLVAGPARAIEIVGDSTQTSEPSSLGAPLVVRVVDESANPVTGEKVTFTFVALTTATSSTTDAGGFASFTGWRLPGKVGTYLVIAAVDGLPGATFRIFARVGTPAVANPISVPASIEVATSATVSVRIVDKYGNPIPFSPVTWTAPIGGGRVSPASTITDEEGATSTTVTMPRTAGTTRTRVTLAGGATQDIFISATAGVPTRLVVSPTRSAIAVGATTTVRATLFDFYDNPVPNAGLAARTVIRAGLGTISPASGTTDATGGLTFTITSAASSTTQVYTINSLATSHADIVVVETSGAPLPGLFASSQEITTGVTHVFRCTAFAFLASGAGASAVPITFSLASGQGTIFAGGTSYSTTTDANGFASVDWLLPSAGTFSMSVTSSTPGLYANPTSCRVTAF